MRPRRFLLAAACALSLPSAVSAQGTSMTLGGYIDAYVAWDNGRPPSRSRSFTTQALRHGEFNVNLAYIDLDVTGDFVRGRVALQAGTSTGAGVIAGEFPAEAASPLARHLQEAVVGLRLGDRTWIDAGVFFSHTGSEKWISSENLTYTRSLIADLSPSRLTGVKLTREIRANLTAAAVVVNGWNALEEANADKTVGLRADWRLTRRIAIAYYNLIGSETPDSVPARVRFFNGITGTFTGSALTIAATIDGGRQETDIRMSSWWGASLLTRLQLMERWAAHARIETFQDPDRVVAQSATPFEVWGMSAGLDFEHADGVTWRSEFRNLRAYSPVFAQYDAANGLSKLNYVFVTSLALTF